MSSVFKPMTKALLEGSFKQRNGEETKISWFTDTSYEMTVTIPKYDSKPGLGFEHISF